MRRAQIIDYVFYVTILLYAAGMVFYLISIKHLQVTNNTYLRTMTCIASVNPTERSGDYVKRCYSSAEKTNGINITRYGDGR